MLTTNHYLVSPTTQKQPESIFYIEFDEGVAYLWAYQLRGVKMVYPLLMGIIEREIDYQYTVNCYALSLLHPELTFNFSGFKRFTPDQFSTLYTCNASAYWLVSIPEIHES